MGIAGEDWPGRARRPHIPQGRQFGQGAPHRRGRSSSWAGETPPSTPPAQAAGSAPT
ncbi:MAG: hypothetical protein MZV70_41450 [Desulfobacterales bacterium]|nr:hypothetical protein [Desulfobacterales bacterium]